MFLYGHRKCQHRRLALAKTMTTSTMSVEQAAARLGIGRNQAYEAARRGELPVIKIGKRVLVITAKLNEMLGEAAQ